MYFYPEKTGTAVYSYEFAKYLSEKEYEVSVLSAFPFYPEWKKHKDYPKYKLYFKEKIRNFNVYRCYTYVPKKINSLKRILHELVFSITSAIRFLFIKKPDLFICVSPPFFNMVVSSFICKIRRIPFHCHIQDLQPDTAVDLKMLKNKLLTNILYRLEYSVYKKSTLISGIGQGMLNKIKLKSINDDKLYLLPNWVNFNEINNARNNFTNLFRKRYKLSDQFIILYSGNIGEKQKLETLLYAAKIAQDNNQNLQFILIGNGVKRNYLEELAITLNLNNILFLDLLPKELYLDALLSSDISVILQNKDATDIFIPSKLLNILATGCPVIASVNNNSEAANILKELYFDVIVEPENSKKLYEAIFKLKSRKDILDNLKKEEIIIAKRYFDMNIILDGINKKYKKILP